MSIVATPAAQIVSHFAASTRPRRPCLLSNCLIVRCPPSPPQCPPATSAMSTSPGREASMPAATCPISPGWASAQVAVAAALAAAWAWAITWRHCAVAALTQTSGIRGLAIPPLASFAAPQVISRQKPVTARPDPQTSGLISLRSSARNRDIMVVPLRRRLARRCRCPSDLRPRDLQEPVFQARLFDDHRLDDHPAGDQGGVHVPAAVVLHDELPIGVVR